MRIVVAGGAGSMGRITARDLAEFFPAAETVVADTDLAAARRFAGGLNRKPRAVALDVGSAGSMEKAFRGAFAVINCAPYRFNLDVMRATLAAGAHYLDLGGLFHVTRHQLKLDRAFRRADRLALLGIGAAPGISNLLAAAGASKMDRVREIHIRLGSADRTRYRFLPALPVSYSLKTILEEFSLPPAVFTGGKWKFVAPMSGDAPHRFPSPIGVRHPFFTLHSEVATLPLSYRDQGVREVSFKIAFDPDFVDRVRFLRDLGLASTKPLRVNGCAVPPIEVTSLVAMSQRRPERAGPLRQHEIVRAIVLGEHGGVRRTEVLDCHTVGMPRWGIGTDVNTGCPPAVAVRLLADGKITKRGALAPETCIDPWPFFQALESRGMKVRRRSLKGWEHLS